MERLARLLPFRQFGRLRHLRTPRDCALIGAHASAAAASHLPVKPAAAIASAAPATVVRVYRSASRVIMVGNIEAVSRMIDRCIDEERAGVEGGLLA